MLEQIIHFNQDFPRLVADIGGTYSRLGIQTQEGGSINDIVIFENKHFDSFNAVISAYLNTHLIAPKSAALAIAAAIDGDNVTTANIQWPFSRQLLQDTYQFTRLVVLNDFEALALSLPSLTLEDYTQIGEGMPTPNRPLGLIGPGTGLGVSGLIPTPDGKWIPLRGEGGHTTLPAMNIKEAELIRIIQESYPHISAERLLCSTGLPNLYQAMAQIYGKAPQMLSAPDILQQGLANLCVVCKDVLDTFCAMLGTVAGNLALTLGAQGGVYLGGGILPRLGNYLQNSAFRERFEDKGRLHDFMRHIPTYLIHADNPALRGAAFALNL